jgi:membrane-bound lytic murein transglycosylase D
VDDRFDPYLATDAACRHLKDLYDLYEDWFLVLAAYNSGVGNVNKAIRRAGGTKNYWAIWPYLPAETRGYVPAFIAASFIMNMHLHTIFILCILGILYNGIDTVVFRQPCLSTKLAKYWVSYK